MEINIQNLKDQTLRSIEEGKKKALIDEKQKGLAEMAKDINVFLKAQEIINTIPAKCELAASKGMNYTQVMRETSYDNLESKFINGKWVATITNGPGLLVIDACQKAGLSVETRYVWDDGGLNSWVVVIVSW
jgi:hypothetical protein